MFRKVWSNFQKVTSFYVTFKNIFVTPTLNEDRGCFVAKRVEQILHDYSDLSKKSAHWETRLLRLEYLGTKFHILIAVSN